jgi:hypothetical protein
VRRPVAKLTRAGDAQGRAGTHAEVVTSPSVGSNAPGFRPTALAAASSGMQAASGRLEADARSIATNGPDVGSIVDLNVQTDVYAALARVIRAGDEMTRSAIDLLA